MGLLDTQMQQQPQQQQGGGLLGGAPMGGQMPQQGGQQSEGLKMAMMLSENPSPETVSTVIEMANKSGNPQSGKLAEILSSLDSAEKVKAFADQVIQKIQG